MSISSRIRATDAAFAAVRSFAGASRYSDRRLEPGISDFTFGNPQEMPLPGIVSAIRDKALPHDTRAGLPTRQPRRSRSGFSPNAWGASSASRSSLPTSL
jgi:hypothetical protein